MSEENNIHEALERNVRLKISIIGIGNAGNQIVGRAYKEGYNVFAINSSYKDLSDAVLSEKIPSFIIGEEARGAGKVRELAVALFKENGKKLFTDNDVFADMIESSDVIFVVASTAGGTGSGAAPSLISLLKKMYPNKIVIYYGILPKITDSPTAQSNFLGCMSEISSLNIPYMLADLSYYENISNDVAYEEIGKHVINNIDIISGKYINYSPSGIIDENDMRVIISEPGYLSAYILDKVSADMIEHEGIQAQLINLIKKSPACDINRDKKVSQLGVIVNAPEEIVETTKTGNYDELNDYVGIPYGVFENYSISNTTMGQFIILYSGMNMSQARIEKAKAKIQEKQKQEEAIAKKAGVDFGVDTNNLSIFKDSHRMNILVSATPDDDEEKKGSVLDSFFD
jgi:hypothetical protein